MMKMNTPNQHPHDRFTDEALAAIEARLHRIYKKAADEVARRAPRCEHNNLNILETITPKNKEEQL